MEILFLHFLLLVILINLIAFSQGQQPDSWIRIDCGANRSTVTNGFIWQTDETFIKAGTNHLLTANTSNYLPILKTLRAFTTQNKNCYTLSAVPNTRYFVRAIFYYGNYDGLSSPPTFDLQIDGNPWMTVVSSSTDVLHYEIVYPGQGENISVCLARVKDDQFPFITSLESWPILETMYTVMNQELAWLNSYRYNYGTDDWIIGSPGDTYNRIWEAKLTLPGTINTIADPGTSITYSSEYPPESAILSAIEAENETTSLFLSFTLAKTGPTIYIEAYFTEMSLLATGTRSFEMYADGKPLITVTPVYWTCTTVPAMGQISGTNLTIELRSSANSALPPIISAIEVYIASDPLVTTGTSQNDLNGLEALTSNFEKLEGWSGEPCLPADTVWQWMGCSGSDPPRVTSLNLSGYDLNGILPNFGQMQALENIDLSNNSLSGQIPDFLGHLPNLTTLNLSHNLFSGTLPPSIRDNPRLEYHIDGNLNLDASGKRKNSTATIIGLAVGLPLLFILLILALVYWLTRKQAQQGPNQATGHESGNTPAPDKPEQLVSPVCPSAPLAEGEDEDCIPVSVPATVVDTKLNHQSMVPEMNLEELEGLIDQYNESHHANHQAELTSDDDCVPVGEHIVNDDNDQNMVPDMDLEELDELIQHENERAQRVHKS